MRKGLTIYLALFFLLGPLTAALPASQDALLPACCRRNGAHRCAMRMAMAMQMAARGTNGAPAFSAPLTCPFYPGAANALLPIPHALVTTPASPPLLHTLRITLVAPCSTLRFACSRTQYGRAPPALQPTAAV